MHNTDVAQLVFDQHSFRIGALFWLATCNDGATLPDDLADEISQGDVLKAFDPLPDDIDGTDPEQVAGWLVDERMFGFLSRVDTPTPTAVHGSGYSSHGWGMFGYKWIYAETLEDLLKKAAQMSDGYIQSALKDLRGKK